MYATVYILVIRLVSCRFTGFLRHKHTAVCVRGKTGTDSSSSSVSCVSISNRPSFRIHFIFIIISLAIFLRPNAQLSADPRITLWCFCERVRYTHTHDYGGWRECSSPMVQTSHRTYAARTYLLEHLIARIRFDKASLQFHRISNALASSDFDVFATRIWLQFISSPTYIYWFYFIILPTTRATCSHACAWHPWHTNHPQRSTNQMPLNYKNPNR